MIVVEAVEGPVMTNMLKSEIAIFEKSEFPILHRIESKFTQTHLANIVVAFADFVTTLTSVKGGRRFQIGAVFTACLSACKGN